MRLRLLQPNDAPALLAIYQPYIASSTCTLEINTPTLEEFSARLDHISAQYPYVLCLHNNQPIGYAYACQYRARAGFRWSAELSAYLHPSYTGQGLGSALSNAVMDILKLMGLQTVYTCVTLPNPASTALHASLGFTKLAIYPQGGCKFGRWLDVAWYAKPLGNYPPNPPEPLNLTQAPTNAINAILRQYQKNI